MGGIVQMMKVARLIHKSHRRATRAVQMCSPSSVNLTDIKECAALAASQLELRPLLTCRVGTILSRCQASPPQRGETGLRKGFLHSIHRWAHSGMIVMKITQMRT